jgi:transposase
MGSRHRRRHNKTIYKARNIIERFFARLKHFRRVQLATPLANFRGFVKIAVIALCIK